MNQRTEGPTGSPVGPEVVAAIDAMSGILDDALELLLETAEKSDHPEDREAMSEIDALRVEKRELDKLLEAAGVKSPPAPEQEPAEEGSQPSLAELAEQLSSGTPEAEEGYPSE